MKEIGIDVVRGKCGATSGTAEDRTLLFVIQRGEGDAGHMSKALLCWTGSQGPGSPREVYDIPGNPTSGQAVTGLFSL